MKQSTKHALIYTPVLLLVWWAAMFLGGEVTREVLDGKSTEIPLSAGQVNGLFSIVTVGMIAAFFWLLSSNRRHGERIIYAFLWPLISVGVFTFLGTLPEGSVNMEISYANAQEIGRLLSLFFLMTPYYFVTTTFLGIFPALLVTIGVTEKYAGMIRAEKIAGHRGEEPSPDSGARN